MRRSIKVLIIVLGAVAALVVAIALAVSPITKRYIENHDRELIGREVEMERLRINIFSGSVDIRGFRLKEADGKTDFFSFDHFYVGFNLFKLFSNEVYVRRISLEGPEVKIVQSAKGFNFDDITTHFASDTVSKKEKTEAPSEWKFNINDISLSSGRVCYADRSVGSDLDIKDLSLKIPGIYFSGKDTDAGITLNFTDGGSLSTHLKYNMEKGGFDITAKLRDFDVASVKPYLDRSMAISRLGGRLSVDINARGNTADLADLEARGKATLNGFVLVDADSRQIASADTLTTVISRANLKRKVLSVDLIRLSGLVTEYELNKDGSNSFSTLLKKNGSETETSKEKTEAESEKGEKQPASTADFTLGRLEIARSEFTFADNTLEKPFRYILSDIRANAKDVSLDPAAVNRLTMGAKMNKAGTLHIRWTGTLADLDNQNLTIMLRNVGLKDLSPYALHYFGYPVTKGRLSLESQNIVQNRRLKGTNTLDVYLCEVGKKDKQIKPEYKIPLKLGLYILKDKDGHIAADLPVRGNIDSPQFSYKRILLHTFCTLLIKVAAAPFSFLSGSGDTLEAIAIEPTSFDFTNEQYDKLDALAKIAKEKPEITVKFCQEISLAEAAQAFAEGILRREYYLHIHPEKAGTPLEMIDRSDVEAINLDSQAVAMFADSLGTVRGLAMPASAKAKAATLYNDRARAAVSRFAERRNTRLAQYLTESQGLPADSFVISSDIVEKSSREPLHRYSISADYKGETAAADSDGTDER